MKSFFVIEDHTVTNIGLQQLIAQKAELTCIGSASSKAESLEKIKALTELPDIITLDLFLGEENGLDLLREIRTEYPSVKVLIYSMYAKPGILSLALEAGAHGFVEKTAPEAILITAIKNILAGDTYVQQNLVTPLLTYKTMYDGFTRQEQRIFKKILERKSKTKIAEELNIVSRSVDNYISRILEKTGCNRIEEVISKFGE